MKKIKQIYREWIISIKMLLYQLYLMQTIKLKEWLDDNGSFI